MLLTLFAAGLTAYVLQKSDGTRFERLVEHTHDRIEARLETYLALLRGATGLHAGVRGELTRELFHAYAERLELTRRYPGIQGIGFSRRVRPDNREALVTQARAEGMPSFRVWPDLGHENTTAIVYLEPLDVRNRAALGFDMFSEPVRREAMERAWRSGAPAMSGRVQLKQEILGRKQAGFLVYLPVYRGGVTPRGEAEHRELLDGFIYAPFRADDLFMGIFGREREPRMAFRVYDGQPGKQTLLHDSRRGRSYQPHFSAEQQLSLLGRRWTIQFESTPMFEQRRVRYVPTTMLAVGLVFSGLLFWLAQAQARARARAERSDARHAFLLHLEDTLRTLSQPDELVATCARLLGEHLMLERCAYGEVDENEDSFTILGDYTHGVSSMRGRFKMSQFGGEALRLMREGRAAVSRDVRKDRRISDEDRKIYDAMQIRALICVPLHKHSRFVAGMAVHHDHPHRWSHDEIELVKAVASRCWESIERARATFRLQESEQRFRNMADNASVMMWVTNGDGECTHLNRLWYDFTGCAPREDGDLDWYSPIHPEDRERVLAAFTRSHQDQTIFNAEYRLLRRDGQYRWVLDAAVPRYDAQHTFLGFIGSIIDLTERKLGEEERERALQKAEDAVRIRDEFLSIASHELRTPITALSLNTAIVRNLLSGPAVTSQETLRKKLDAIERQTHRLQSLVDELLDVSRIASGHMRIRREDVNLSNLVKEVVTSMTPVLSRAGCTLRAEVPDFLAAHVDPTRTHQVLENLVENAAKYGAGKPVEVQLESDADELRLLVRDHGVGIAPEDQARIFERFERAVSARHYGGLGLGLWITRQIVEAMGGHIELRSALGEGSTFIVHLPRTELQHAAMA